MTLKGGGGGAVPFGQNCRPIINIMSVVYLFGNNDVLFVCLFVCVCVLCYCIHVCVGFGWGWEMGGGVARHALINVFLLCWISCPLTLLQFTLQTDCTQKSMSGFSWIRTMWEQWASLTMHRYILYALSTPSLSLCFPLLLVSLSYPVIPPHPHPPPAPSNNCGFICAGVKFCWWL